MPQKTSLKLLTFLFLFLLSSKTEAQKDTEFWFVAPEVAQGANDYDRPVAFVVSSYEQSAVVTISQPANSSFPPQIITLAANTSGRFNFPPFFEIVENTPPNTTLDKGFLITSTAPVTIYYEVIGLYQSNPEIFSLKGKNALGTEFYIPFQNIMANSNAYAPLPSAAFDIVATENATKVIITPSANIVGHAAGTSFTINLNRGQTYSAQATSQNASGHPAGSKVVSDKPIAITMKDDLLEGGLQYGGSCRDMVGDQIVPVSNLGTRYIVQKGLLYSTENIFVLSTAANTTIKKDGVLQANLNAGKTLMLPVSDIHFIEASAPVYVLQISGNGCETGGEIMPALDCGGSRSLRFVRPTDEPLMMFLSTKAGFEAGFSLNGGQLPASFSTVPGSNGEFVATSMLLSNSDVPAGFSSIVENSLGVFQMGFLNGQEDATGCRFAFFSDFGNHIPVEDSVSFCEGESVLLHGLLISEEGLFEKKVSNPDGCDTLFKITAKKRLFNVLEKDVYFCEGSSVMINGVSYTQEQEVVDTIQSIFSCDTIIHYSLHISTLIPSEQTLYLCPGASISFNGTTFTQPDVVTSVLSSGSGCDTLLTTIIEWAEMPVKEFETVFCEGHSVVIGGVVYTQPGIVYDTIPATTGGCDTLSVNLLKVQYALPFLSADTFICAAEQILLRSPYSQTFWNGEGPANNFNVISPGLVIAVATDEEGCVQTDSVLVQTCCSDKNVYLPNIFSPNDDGLNDEFCLYATERCNEFNLRIYDRWGSCIFESRNNTCWDGNSRGRAMPAGVYTWFVELRSDMTFSQRVLKGDVTLIR